MEGLRKVFNIANLQLFIYAYACTKLVLGSRHDSPFTNIIIIILRIILALPLAIVTFLLLIIFAIYYEIANCLLSFKYGDKFKGLLNGSDALWTLENKTRSIINSLFILGVEKDESCDAFYQFFRREYGKLSTTHTKMGCVRKKFMGFQYFHKTKIQIEDFVKYMEDYRNEDELQVLLDKYSNSALPMEDTALWEIYIGKTPIKWKRGGEKTQYPIFIKYHHCIGDGIAIVAMMTSNLIKGGVDIMRQKCETYRALLEKNKKPKTGLVEKCRELLRQECYIKYSGPLFPKDTNLLHGKKLSGEKHLCWALENEGAKYVEKVKRIKNRFKNVSFNDVVMTAMAASFADYYKKFNQEPPANIRAALTYYLASSDFDKIINFKNNNAISTLRNNFTLGIVDVPISGDGIENNLMGRLDAMRKDYELLKKAIDFPFIYWQIKVVSSIVPLPLLLYSVQTNDNTLVVTNVPGNTTSETLIGHTITDTIIWAPNFLKTGITFSIFTYDNLFRFGLLLDKVLIEKRHEVQAILDNIFTYIDLLDLETNNN